MTLESTNTQPGHIGIQWSELFDTLPFWMEFFGRLGIKVELSTRSSYELYQRGRTPYLPIRSAIPQS